MFLLMCMLQIQDRRRFSSYAGLKMLYENVVLKVLGFFGGNFNCTENDKLEKNNFEPNPASKTCLKHLMETFSRCVERTE